MFYSYTKINEILNYGCQFTSKESFAPVRNKQLCKWYINSSQYFEHLMDALNNAKEEIYITDWCLWPELFLKRPTEDLEYRLDKILIKKSHEGVKVYIILFREIEFTISLWSSRAKKILTENGKNINIKVFRYPERSLCGVFLWSNHEKMVIIDQSVAFMGGIDLCYGRWDDDYYRLDDLGLNSTIKNHTNRIPNDTKSETDLEILNVGRKIISKRSKTKKGIFDSLRKKINSNLKSDFYSENEGTNEKKNNDSNMEIYWIGVDYYNVYKSELKDIKDFKLDYIERKKVPRMPWRDQCLVVIGESARDLARHFIQRWNKCKEENSNNKSSKYIETYPYLLPKIYSDVFDYDHANWFKDKLFACEVKMVRSLSKWSGGFSETEISIYKAYCELIQKAEEYIYIENQFFVTATENKGSIVKNLIGAELVNRIFKAHIAKKNFRVYVVLPLLPGFDKPNAVNAVQYFNLRSIINGEGSIIELLKNLGVQDPHKYITFHGMRNWAILSDNLVQEIIYVHSKLMIVDDKYVICGSANINDRSLLGERDSEVAAVVKDEEYFESILDGKKVLVGKYANSLRIKIFKLHLGCYFNNPEKIDVQDCVCDEFYEYFRSVSKKNTEIYDEVFKCLPSDKIKNFEELKTYENQPCLSKNNPAMAKDKLEKELKGYIVDFPLIFLSEKDCIFPTFTPEGILPIEIWT